MKYFYKQDLKKSNVNISLDINSNSSNIKGLLFFNKPLVGDVLKVYFSKNGSIFFLRGFVLVYTRRIFFYQIQGLS